MLSKIKAILALISFAGIAGKFGGVLGLLGPVGAMAGAVLTFISQLIKWFFEGVTVIVSNPVTLVTVALCSALSFGSGVKLTKDWYQHLIDQKQAVITKMIADSKRADDANKLKLKAALADKAAAEKAEKDKIATEAKPATADPVQPKRVRKARTSCKDSGGGPSLFPPGSVWGSALPCKST